MRLFDLFDPEAPDQEDALSPLHHSTPVELVDGHDRVWVKREDLSCPLPGPCFSKIRGVYARIKKQDAQVIGVLDTYHSKAGWAVAYICHILGKQCVDFYPQYKADDPNQLRPQQQEALKFGATLHPLPAGRSAILYHQAVKETKRLGGYMMPNALKLEETVTQCASEVQATPGLEAFDHLVISISSATIAAGVLRGFYMQGLKPQVWLHMGYERSETEILRYLRSHHPDRLGFEGALINEGYAYKDQARTSGDWKHPPFPCNPYYDLKAWRWLELEGLSRMKGNVLFWNIGS